MSKRYGRNQKRKHRQELAEAQKNLAIKSSELLYTKSLDSKQKYAISLMADILNRNFPLLHPETKTTDHVNDHFQAVNYYRPCSLEDNLTDSISSSTYVIENLVNLQAKGLIDEFSSYKHMYLRVGPSTVAYSITPQFFDTLSDQQATDHIAYYTAPLILQEIKKLR